MKFRKRKFAVIYMIHNTKVDKYYVGKSVDCFNRWQSHLQQLFYKKHHNKDLQKDFDEGSYRDLKFEILKVSTKKKINDLEKYYIEKLNNSGKVLYNKTKGG